MAVLSRDDVTEVFLAAQPTLENIVFRRLGCRETARDLSQDIFFKLDKLVARFATRDDARRFLIRVAINAAADRHRVDHRRVELLEWQAFFAPEDNWSMEEHVTVKDDMTRIDVALGELPEKCRDVLYLSRIEGLTHPEIAARLCVSRSLVEKYAVRAMAHCRERLMSGQ